MEIIDGLNNFSIGLGQISNDSKNISDKNSKQLPFIDFGPLGLPPPPIEDGETEKKVIRPKRKKGSLLDKILELQNSILIKLEKNIDIFNEETNLRIKRNQKFNFKNPIYNIEFNQDELFKKNSLRESGSVGSEQQNPISQNKKNESFSTPLLVTEPKFNTNLGVNSQSTSIITLIKEITNERNFESLNQTILRESLKIIPKIESNILNNFRNENVINKYFEINKIKESVDPNKIDIISKKSVIEYKNIINQLPTIMNERLNQFTNYIDSNKYSEPQIKTENISNNYYPNLIDSFISIESRKIVNSPNKFTTNNQTINGLKSIYESIYNKNNFESSNQIQNLFSNSVTENGFSKIFNNNQTKKTNNINFTNETNPMSNFFKKNSILNSFDYSQTSGDIILSNQKSNFLVGNGFLNTIENISSFLTVFIDKLDNLKSFEILNPQKQINSNTIKTNEASEKLNINFDLDKINTLGRTLTPTLMMSTLDTNQFNSLMDTLEKNSQIISDGINSKNNQSNNKLINPNIQISTPKIDEGEKRSQDDKIVKIMTSLDEKMGMMLSTLNNISSWVNENRMSSTSLRPHKQ